MNTTTMELPVNSARTDIAVIVAQNPAIVLVDTQKRDDLYAHIRREVEAFVPDVSTAKGRDAITSLAFKITRTKTAIDDAGKKLNEEARAKINIVDAARRDARETLERMSEEVRKPLTEWKEAEKARVAECQLIIDSLKAAATVTLEDTAASVRDRGAKIWNQALDQARFGDMLDEAQSAKEHAVATLKSALARLEKEEADRAELERLRTEAAERAEADRIAAEKAEAERQEAARKEAERVAAEQAKAEAARQAALAEERRIAAERAEAERIERAKQEAAEAAQREAEAAAQAERDRIQREHEEALAAERAKAAEAERLRQAEADRIAEQERQREAREAAERAEEQRLAEEQAAREANQKHRTAVKRAAKEAIMTCGAPEEVAQKIVLAIIAGEVPAVTLRF